MDLDELGSRIRTARTERGLTLQELAAAAGVSVSMLSSVERAEKAATIVVLDRIARGLGVPLPRLVASPSPAVTVRRAAEQDVVDEPGGWRRTILTPVVPGVGFEWIRTQLPAGCDAGTFPAYAPGSHEFVVVDAGTLRLTVGDETLELGPGDSVHFAADVPHGYANPGSRPCSYHVAALTMRPRTPGGGTRGLPQRPAGA